ncbi:AAA family ATPase [Aliikangiella maris]|uniref:AAA family ATPase n=2 Tax=Aliikangiella maris TaxID=3162458 RepID=A0ABV2BWJ0_9GAMM
MSYISQHKNQLLDSIESHVLYADICCVVIGQPGTGKSFFIEKLAERLDSKVSTSQIQASQSLTLEQLEKTVSLQLGLGWQASEATLYQRIAESLDHRALLIIDDAHLLSQTCLEYLISMVFEQFEAKKTDLYIILLGVSSLAEKLNQTSTLTKNPNICAVFELQPIEGSETKALIADFNALDEQAVESLFDEQKMHYFWELSQGIPGNLKYQLERWLAESDIGKVTFSAETKSLKKYLQAAIYGIFALLLITVLIYQQEINQTIEGEQTEASLQKQPLSENNTQKEISVENESVASQPNEEQSVLVENETSDISENRKFKNENIHSSESVKGKQSEEQNTTSLLTQTALVNKIETLDNKLNSSDDKIEGTLNKDDNLKEKVVAKISLPKNTSNSSAKTKEQIAPKNQLTKDEVKLFEYSDSQFTLQWAALSSLSSAQEYRDGHPLKDKMLIFRKLKGDKFLYLVVSGQFNSHDDAEHTRIIYLKRSYPGKAWIKSAKAIKNEMATLAK